MIETYILQIETGLIYAGVCYFFQLSCLVCGILMADFNWQCYVLKLYKINIF